MIPRRLALLLALSTAALSTLPACSRSPVTDEAPSQPAASNSGSAERHGHAVALAGLERPALIRLALAQPATSERHAAIVERLREGGPASLDALIHEYASVPARPAAEDRAWRALIDAVAQQRDARYGGLFWYRDMNRARAEAAATGKPILSLRMLGELTSEYSCANSRLFRTLLYADPELASWLEQRFVLHWSSERPVPRLAIDFGDGRRVERTITGNSAHFVLDASGRTLDVIPGLLARPSFRAALADSLELHAELAASTDDLTWRDQLHAHHDRRFEALAARLRDELTRVRGLAHDLAAVQAWLGSPAKPVDRVPAIVAVPQALGKSKIEAPILALAPLQLGGQGPTDGRPRSDWLAPNTWELERIGERVAGEVELHPNSEAIIAGERPLDGLVDAHPAERERAEAALRETLVRSIQADTGKNALELHARIHLELARRALAEPSLGFAEVDEWLYAELFRTPASDPWLGLIDPAVYTGLERGGVRPPR